MRLRRPERPSPLLLDVLAAFALTAFTQYEVWSADRAAAPLAAQSACFAAATLSVAGRRRAPVPALTVASAALTVVTLALGEVTVVGGFLAALALTYAVGAYASLRPRARRARRARRCPARRAGRER